MQFLFTKTPLTFLAASFWRDEAFSYLMAKQPLMQLLWSTAKDANPPFYYLLLKVWMLFVGHSEIALRTLSLLFFWATIYVCFCIMKNVFRFSQKNSLVYLLLFVANPLLYYYAFEARMYSILAFLATLSFYFLFTKQYKKYGIVALLSLYTHYFLISVIGAQLFFSFFFFSKKEFKTYFSTLIKYLILFVPWILLLAAAHPPVGNSFWIETPALKDVALLPAIIFTGYEKTAWLTYKPLPLVSVIVGLIVLFGIWFFFYNQRKHLSKERFFIALLLLVWGMGIPLCVFFFSFLKPIFLPRYLIFATVGLLLFMVLTIESMHVRMKYILFVALLVVSVHYGEVQILFRTKAPVRKTFMEIKQMMTKNDVVYVLHEYDFHPAEYYINDSQVFIYNKSYEELPWFIGKVLIPKDKVTSLLPTYPRRAFIVEPDATSYSIRSIY